MAHERDDNKYDGQEDGEYHFSEDQGGYDSEPEVVTTKAAPAGAGAPAPAAVPLKIRLNQHRKQLIGVGVFFLLIFLVYKISAPTTQGVPNTDFAQNAGTIPAQKPVMKQLPKAMNTAQQSDFQPMPQAAGMSTASPTTATAPAPVQQPVVTQAQNTMPPGMPETATAAPPPPIPETPATVMPSVTTTTVATTHAPAENYYNPAQPNSGDKLSSMVQENAKLAAEYAQKLAEQQAQNAALQNQIQDLTQRLASMESTLAHLGRIVQDIKPGRGGMSASPLEQQQTAQVTPPPPSTAPSGDPKSVYTVQAIIPGRAWLKAENGETVTVAEGDILKNYGRIMKIDPYDGVVQIDTGSHIMNLAYGVSTD